MPFYYLSVLCRGELRCVLTGQSKVRGDWPNGSQFNWIDGRITRGRIVKWFPTRSGIWPVSFSFLFRSRLGVVMKPRESIAYAVECVMLLLLGGVIVDWIFSAAPISFSQASRFPVLTFQYQFSYLEATESSCYKKKCKLIKKIEALRGMVHFSPGRDQWFSFVIGSINCIHCVPYWLAARDADAAVGI